MQTAAQIIASLGGSAEVARETDTPLTTIESWKTANFIPVWRRPALLAAATKRQVTLSTADFPQRSSRDRAATEQVAA